jgi:recombination DNA repair RAD52 pathway protein
MENTIEVKIIGEEHVPKMTIKDGDFRSVIGYGYCRTKP